MRIMTAIIGVIAMGLFMSLIGIILLKSYGLRIQATITDIKRFIMHMIIRVDGVMHLQGHIIGGMNKKQEGKTMEYTKEQVIEFTINILSGINVPVPQIDEIGVPISKALRNLQIVQLMMKEEKEKQDQSQDEKYETDGIDFGEDGDEDGNGENHA